MSCDWFIITSWRYARGRRGQQLTRPAQDGFKAAGEIVRELTSALTHRDSQQAVSSHRWSPSPVGRLTVLGESFLMLGSRQRTAENVQGSRRNSGQSWLVRLPRGPDLSHAVRPTSKRLSQCQDVRPDDDAEVLQLRDAQEGHKVFDAVLVGSASYRLSTWKPTRPRVAPCRRLKLSRRQEPRPGGNILICSPTLQVRFNQLESESLLFLASSPKRFG